MDIMYTTNHEKYEDRCVGHLVAHQGTALDFGPPKFRGAAPERGHAYGCCMRLSSSRARAVNPRRYPRSFA
ncbi:hypothetical protein HPP92_012052 [Vanilla planifolia]|uniref:Uncharacterized protein n=1 Tax=Vanilla planifolia TaxID=51239 RepID=A0A835V433_VANPL|nr:hypothetical protein HPP92_012052 [Vanilla planifolia]